MSEAAQERDKPQPAASRRLPPMSAAARVRLEAANIERAQDPDYQRLVQAARERLPKDAAPPEPAQ